MPAPHSKKIGVLMGGPSAERWVSEQSGLAVEASLRRQGYPYVLIDVTKHIIERVQKEKIELAFLALHGGWGEDGTIQAILDVLAIPYTGSGVLASAMCMNKGVTKRILQSHGLPTAQYTVYEASSKPTSIPDGMKLPVVIKPASQGSTLGVHIVRKKSEVKGAYADAFQYDREVMVEQYIPGHEITAGIMQDTVLPLVEIVPEDGFYNFKAKYEKGATQYIVPAQLKEDTAEEIRRLALKAHRMMGCEVYSRVDFRLTDEGEPYILEVNTLPGLTETSLLPKAAQAAGIDYDGLVFQIIKGSINKRGKSETQTH